MSGACVLVTGYPTSFLARKVVENLLSNDGDEVVLLVQEKFEKTARQQLRSMPFGRRASILIGDASSMDLGLSGKEYLSLAQRVTMVQHCAAVTYLGSSRKMAEATNIGGARELIELADSASRLEKIVYWSTALVSGSRRGYVLEDELPPQTRFRNVVEETRHRAERVVRESLHDFPITILRPGVIVGDSHSGEIDRLEGPYLLMLLMLNAPDDMRIPLPGRGDIPLHLVPIDYVVQAGLKISFDPSSTHRTFHIIDPNPLSARRAFDLIAKAAGKPAPRGSVPTRFAARLMKVPGLGRYAHVPRTFLEQLGTEVVYDDRNTKELLGSELHCPEFETYVEQLMQFVKEHQARPSLDIGLELEEIDVGM